MQEIKENERYDKSEFKMDENVQETIVMDLFVNESGEISVETVSRG